MDIIKPVFPVIVPYIAAGMVRSVMYGMAWAMQEFACKHPLPYPGVGCLLGVSHQHACRHGRD